MDYENPSLAREGHGVNDKHTDKAIDMIKLIRVINEKGDDKLKTLAEKTSKTGSSDFFGNYYKLACILTCLEIGDHKNLNTFFMF